MPCFFYVIVGSQGLLGYGITSIIGAIPAELFEGKRFSTIFGILSISAGWGASTSPWLTGYFLDRYGNYEFAWWLALVLNLVSIFCIGKRRLER